MTTPTQPSDAAARTLDDVLAQAFTDGASDTMWKDERHVEIFATAKKELEAIITTSNTNLLQSIKAKVPGKYDNWNDVDRVLLHKSSATYNNLSMYRKAHNAAIDQFNAILDEAIQAVNEAGTLTKETEKL